MIQMFREILTKAVVGKGKSQSLTIHELTPTHQVSRTLGCWIINSKLTPYIKSENSISIEGSFDVHIWYGYNNDTETDVLKKTIEYKENIQFKMKPGEKIGINNELKSFHTKYPSCSKMQLLDNGNIEVTVEKEIVVDAIGETKLKVQITQGEEEWLLDSEIESSINPNYVIDSHKNTEIL